MTLDEFISKYHYDGSIVLIEGKRIVQDSDKNKLIELGKLLATKTLKIIFRSGNADGADQLFTESVISVDNTRMQVIITYSGHRSKTNLAYQIYSLDEINMVNEPEVIY